MLKKLKWMSLFTLLMVLGYWGCLEFPAFLFAHKHQNENLSMYSDQPFPPNIKTISDGVLFRLKKSDLFIKDEEYRVHIANEDWRWRFISHNNYVAGGFNTGFRHNSFIRPSDIANNQITIPSNNLADPHLRDLIYFISHEVGHGLMFEEVGYINNFLQHPKWVQEGYPDYVPKGTFDFEANLAQFSSGHIRLSERSAQRGLYVRYHLYMACLIDRQGLSIQAVILLRGFYALRCSANIQGFG
jgi:hypothetical protein